MANKNYYKKGNGNWFSKLPKWAQITSLSVLSATVLGLSIWGITAISNAAKLNEQLKCDHEYGAGVVTREAICDVDGVLSYTCPKCDKVKTEAIPMLGHNTKIIEGYEATCMTEGKTDGTLCIVCNKTVTEQKAIPKLGHNIVVDKSKVATCLENGLTEGQHCKRCDEVLIKQEVIQATGHNIISVKGYSATCMEAGLSDGTKCANCETVYSAQVVIEPLGHKPVSHAGKAATCLEKGWNSYITCERTTCSYSTYEEQAALGHNFSNAVCLRCSYQLPEGHECVYTLEEVSQATCEDDGVKIKKCVCGQSTTETIPAYGHAWNSGVVTIEPTCGVEGQRTYTCSNCGNTRMEAITAINHEFNETTIQELSCTQDGIKKYECVNCHYYYTNTTEANGHDNDDGFVSIVATCTTDGEKVYTCKTCGALTREKIAKLPHTEKTLAYEAATCTTTGKTAGKICSVCNTVIIEQKDIPALGHSFDEWEEVSELTCTQDGVSKRTCNVCGKQETSTVKATGHNHEETDRVDATCTELGYVEYTCENCGDVKKENLQATGHKFIGGVCTKCGEMNEDAPSIN